MNKRMLNLILLISIIVSGCKPQNSSDFTLEYGSTYDPYTLFGINPDENIEFSMNVNTNVVGKYQVEWIRGEEKVVKEVQVKDTALPDVVLTLDFTTQLLMNSTFDPLANIESITDSVDGAITNIRVVSAEEFESIEKHMEELKETCLNQVFKTEEEIQTFVNNREQGGFAVVKSEVDASTLGEYNVEVMVIDSNYNRSYKDFTIEVVEEITDEDTEAVGAGGSSFEVPVETPNNPQQSNPKPSTTKPNNPQPTRPAVTDPLVKAALKYEGQDVSCDILVTKALVDTGRVGGEPTWFDFIGVYYYPQMCTKITKDQARPGDLVLYDDGGHGIPHVGVYMGNDMAVHGGFNGKVKVYSIYIEGASSPMFYRFPDYMTWKEIDEAIFGKKPDNSGNSGNNSVNNSENDSNSNTGSNTGYAYTLNYSVNELKVVIVSNEKMPSGDEVSGPITEYYLKEITYEQMKEKIAAMGYLVYEG